MPRKKRLSPTIQPPSSPWFFVIIAGLFLVLVLLSLGSAIKEKRLVVRIAPEQESGQTSEPDTTAIDPSLLSTDSSATNLNEDSTGTTTPATQLISPTQINTQPVSTQSTTVIQPGSTSHSTPSPAAAPVQPTPYSITLPSINSMDTTQCNLYVGTLNGTNPDVCTSWRTQDGEVRQQLMERQMKGMPLELLKAACVHWLETWNSIYKPTENSPFTLPDNSSYQVREQLMDQDAMIEIGCVYPVTFSTTAP